MDGITIGDLKFLIAGSVGDKLNKILRDDLDYKNNCGECVTLSKKDSIEILKKYY